MDLQNRLDSFITVPVMSLEQRWKVTTKFKKNNDGTVKKDEWRRKIEDWRDIL